MSKKADSKLVSVTDWSPNYNEGNYKKDGITIHCFVGQVSVERGLEVFTNPKRQASCQYVIGYDGKIGQGVLEKDRSWCSSNRTNDERCVTIETASENFHPYAITDEAYKALVNLCVDICQRNGIEELKFSTSKDERVNRKNGVNMTVHRDYANKSCPGDYIYDRLGNIANEVNAILNPEPTPTPEPTPVPEGDFDKYTAVKGDNLTKIAKKFNTTVDYLMEINPQIKDANKIYEGQVINVPKKVEPQPEPTPELNLKDGDKVIPIDKVDYRGVKLVQWDDFYYLSSYVATGSKADTWALMAERNGKRVAWARLKSNNIKKI